MTDEEYEWPSLVEEGRDLLSASILMYGVTDLRSLARQGKLAGDSIEDRILTLPITVQDVLDVAADNRQLLQDSCGPENYKMYGSALHSLEKEAIKEEVDGQKGANADKEVIAFDDEHSEEELVYAISINKAAKRVIVAFRGSVTPRDFLVDASGSFNDLDNPLNPESKEKLGIHHGFYQYLNGTRKPAKSKNGEEDETPKNKYTEIMLKVKPIFDEHPDYRLYVTGHSLGASLAILFAVEAAGSTSYSVTMPVTCINFASPKVGNVFFRNCFQTLELERKLRCIRFVNSGDIISTLPDRQNYNLCRVIRCKSSVYRHCGPKVILYPDGEYQVAYEKDDVESLWEFLREVRYTFGHGIGFVMMVPTLIRFKKFFLTNHGCGTYFNRFNQEFSKSNLYLEDIYKQEVKVLEQKQGRANGKP